MCKFVYFPISLTHPSKNPKEIDILTFDITKVSCEQSPNSEENILRIKHGIHRHLLLLQAASLQLTDGSVRFAEKSD